MAPAPRAAAPDPRPVESAEPFRSAARERAAGVPAPEVGAGGSAGAPAAAAADTGDADLVRGNEPILRGAPGLRGDGAGVSRAAPRSSARRSGNSYGPVPAGSGLYSVAKEVQPAGLTLNQVALSLFEANPAAFENGSANSLRRGATLQVPTAEQMAAVSPAQAQRRMQQALDGAAPTRRAAAGDERGDTGSDAARDAARDVARDSGSRRDATRAGANPATPGSSGNPANRDFGRDSGSASDSRSDSRSAAADSGRSGTLPTAGSGRDAPAAGDTSRGSEEDFAAAPDAFDDAPDAFDSAPDAFDTPAAGDSAAAAGDAGAGDDAGAGFGEEGFQEDGFTDEGDVVVNVNQDVDQSERAAPVRRSEGGGVPDTVFGLPLWMVAAVVVVIVLLLLAAVLRRRGKRGDEPDVVMAAPPNEGVGKPRPADEAFATTATTAAAVASTRSEDEDDTFDTVTLDQAPLTEGESDRAPDGDSVTREFVAADTVDQSDTQPDGVDPSLLDTTAMDDTQAVSPAEDTPTLAGFDTVDGGEEEDPFALDAESSSDDAALTGHDTISIDISQDDPISEADFHMAYGLYDEAEATLKSALEKEPERLDLREKLAETYFAAGKTEDFEAVAKEIHERDPNSQAWGNVALLGSQLLPDSPLFQDGASGAAVDMDFDTGDGDGGDAVAPGDNWAEEPVAAVEPEQAEELKADSDDNSIDFDGASDLTPPGDSDGTSASAGTEPAADQGNVIDFDDSLLTSDSDSGAGGGDAEPAQDPAGGAPEDQPTMQLDVADLELPDAPAGDDADSGLEFSGPSADAAGDDDELSLDSLEDDFGDGGDSGEELTLEDLSDDGGDFELGELDTDGDSGEDLSSEELSGGDFTLDEEGAGDAPLDDQTIDMGDETLAATDPEEDAALQSLQDEAAGSQTIDFDEFEAEDTVSEGDDMSGKLDLARAYIDMSEIDMARSLLDEVAARGNEDQQTEARAMLESLG